MKQIILQTTRRDFTFVTREPADDTASSPAEPGRFTRQDALSTLVRLVDRLSDDDGDPVAKRSATE